MLDLVVRGFELPKEFHVTAQLFIYTQLKSEHGDGYKLNEVLRAIILDHGLTFGSHFRRISWRKLQSYN